MYYAVADSRYFIGAVALVNSLRITGNTGPIVMLDSGLHEHQRGFLERECTVLPLAVDAGMLTVFSKPFVHRLERTRTVVLLDTDAIVTASLQPIVSQADAGMICGFRDVYADRHFREWERLFSLRAPLRHGAYTNGGFLAFSMERWHWLVERWWEVSQAVQEERSKRAFLLRRAEAEADPVGFNEQDTLNALLMSEAPDGAVFHIDGVLAPTWSDRRRVCVVDEDTLRCSVDGREPYYLHYTGAVKPWQPWAWTRPGFDAFLKLLPRILFAADVPLRLGPEDVPFWLRDAREARVAFRLLNGTASAAYALTGLIPEDARSRVTHALRTRLAHGHRRSGK